MKRKKFEAAAMAAILAAMSLNGSLIHVSAAENNGSEDDFANQIAENTEASEGDTESASSEAAKTNSGKIEFQADSFQGGTAAIWINDTKVPVNMDRRTADLTAYIQPGENTITVRVTSSLRNIMITQGYDGWIFGTPDPDDYGMTGETKLVYTK